MDPHSILDHGQTPELRAPEKPREWPWSQTNAPAAPGEARFPGEDGGKSLTEMAQKDLTATLQLLAEQAQYITGATGAAIALRDHGEMVCRASAGHSAPEVGAQLQVNSGLSGESLRTGQTLRCDDAATDPRVNRESCEALGIASVVVMPLIQSNDVIGVFELFSDKAHVFEGRDITALERMGAMVFTALEHAMAAHGVTIWPERANGTSGTSPNDAAHSQTGDENPERMGERAESDRHSVSDLAAVDGNSLSGNGAFGHAAEAVAVPEIPETVSGIAFHGSGQTSVQATSSSGPAKVGAASWHDESDDILGDLAQKREPALGGEMVTTPHRLSMRSTVDEEAGKDSILEGGPVSPGVAPGKQITAGHAPAAEGADGPAPIRSAVASLKKCEACGFPISEGRQFCLDCEKKEAGTAATKDAGASGVMSRPAPLSSTHLAAAPESGSDDSLRLFKEEIEEESWFATHKYMVLAIAIAAVIIVALLLAH
jgi:putative methionine-R-sulfoxide reductase with GAF domain